MRNVYAWMALGLLMTALTAVLVASTPSVIYALASSPMLIFALFALELGMVIWMSARIHKMAATTAGILFALYAVLNGVTMSFIFLAYDTQKIKQLVEYASATGDEEQTTKLALMGSLTLYHDFINLFLYLLRIFGRRR